MSQRDHHSMKAPLGLEWSKHQVTNAHKLYLSPFHLRHSTQAIESRSYHPHSHVKCASNLFSDKVPRHHKRLIHLPITTAKPLTTSVLSDLRRRTRAMHSWIQFITTPTADTPGTGLLLHFDEKRYLVGNIHEGFSRACIQMGVRLVKASGIFLTGKTEWKNTGGLMGLILTLADTTTTAANDVGPNSRAGHPPPGLTIHGGDNVTFTLATGRRFIFRKGMPVHVNEYSEKDGTHKSEHGWQPDWEDRNIQVWAMVIEPSRVEEATTPAQPTSPRKRSFDDFTREDRPTTESVKVIGSGESSLSLEKEVCANIVVDMFSSSWQKKFEELPLAEVAPDAKIFVHNKNTNKNEPYTGPRPGEGEVPDIKVLVRRPWPAAVFPSRLRSKPSHSAMSYIIRCQRQRGKFLVEKATALNVPSGPLRSRLAKGSDVQLEDGTIITPEMVLGPSKAGGGVVVAELPSQDYVHNLLSRPEWKALEIMTGVEVVIWILGAGVSQNDELQKFMNDHKHLKHIISSSDHCPNYLAFSSSAAQSNRLNQVDSVHYRVPIHNNVTMPHVEQPSIEENGASEIILAERGLRVQLEPSISIKREKVVLQTHTGEIEPELSQDVRSLVEHARRDILSEPTQTEMDNQNLPCPDAEIIFLGTGSASPSKYRNVSATLLRVPEVGSYLLDCGENTLGQLRRFYSPTELGQVFRDLRLIWISHLHADHLLGIVSLIKAWAEEVYGDVDRTQSSSRVSSPWTVENPNKALVGAKRLYVVSSQPLLGFLDEYTSIETFGYDRIVPLASYPAGRSRPYGIFLWDGEAIRFDDAHSSLTNEFQSTTGLAEMATCHVKHCQGSQAISLTFPNGFKFSYSGDCMPSPQFVDIGRDSTVLLHEATFEDERHEDARAKHHSTTSEAIAVGKRMGARRILLTHFSQRYSKIPIGMGSMKADLTFDEDAEELSWETPQAPIPVGEIHTENSIDETARSETARSEPAKAQPILSSSESTASFAGPPAIYEAAAGAPGGVPIENLNVGLVSDPMTFKSESIDSPNGPSSTQRATTNPASEDASAKEPKVGVAFDFMHVKVKDIMLLEKFNPALVELFKEDEAEDPDLDAEPKKTEKKTKAKNRVSESKVQQHSAIS